MALFLEVLEGGDRGRKFRAQEGARLGRKLGEILLNDQKLSAFHAQIEKNPKGELVLVDADTESGLEINGRKVKRVLLKPGVTFTVGSSILRVLEEEHPKRGGHGGELDGMHGFTSLSAQQNIEPWKVQLFDFFQKNAKVKNQAGTKIAAFKPIFSLLFIKGIQADTEWTMGWGPRQVGRDSLEFRLLEMAAPNQAFDIFPDEWGQPVFYTSHPRIVLVNDQSVSKKTLEFGDKIKIADSEIEIIRPRGD